MDPYCTHLRERVILAAEASNETHAAIAASFGVSLSTVEKWLHRKRATGEVAAHSQVHGPKRTLQSCAKFIRAQVKQQPDITLAELCERTVTFQGVKASASMMCRELQHLGLPQKKVIPCERAGNAVRQTFAARIRRTKDKGIQSLAQALEICR